MAILKDVEVRVVTKANKQQLTEYDKPNAVVAAAGDDSIEKYVEAKTGEDFQVEVYFKKSFDCFDAWGIYVGINIDGGVVSFAEVYSKHKVRELQDGKIAIIFDSVHQPEKSVGSLVGFRFGSLNLGKSWTLSILISLTLNGADENMDSSKDTLEAQAENLGVINITIDRVNRKRLPKPKEKGSFYKPLASINVSKELIKKELVSSFVGRPGEKTLVKPLPLEYYKYKRYKGKNCGFSVFKFRYRSKMHLQLLGCISGSPSPTGPDVTNEEVSVMPAGSDQTPVVNHSVPVAAKAEFSDMTDGNGSRVSDTNSADTANGLAKENQELKQRLKDIEAKQADMMQAFMGGFSNAMQSAFTTAISSFIGPTTPPTTPVKRERVKEEGDAGNPGQTANSGGRPVKRSKTVIELD
ncbi:MAG: hypothetical protein LQ341_007019 [Variospora aurantia]|nr:MAG: hypothetical protein LQ341_007019 [Variospora aurantia]